MINDCKNRGSQLAFPVDCQDPGAGRRLKTGCKHEHVEQLAYLYRFWPAVHGPCTEVWRVRCLSCESVLEESFIGD